MWEWKPFHIHYNVIRRSPRATIFVYFNDLFCSYLHRIIITPKIPMSETVLWKVWSSILPWCPSMQKARVSVYRKVVQKHLITLWYWWKIGHLPKIFIPATLENFFVLHYGHHLRVNNLWDFRNKELWISPYPYPSRERNQDSNLE